MKTAFNTIAFAALAAGALAAGASGAFAHGKRVHKACEDDYMSFCSQYDPNSAAVSRCFESNRKNLSRNCIRALVDAGEVPAKYLKK